MKKKITNKNRYTTTEFIYTWPNGRKEVRYRRSYKSTEALELIAEVKKLQKQYGLECPYSYIHTNIFNYD